MVTQFCTTSVNTCIHIIKGGKEHPTAGVNYKLDENDLSWDILKKLFCVCSNSI